MLSSREMEELLKEAVVLFNDSKIIFLIKMIFFLFFQNNHVKLCDFRIAKMIESITQTMTSNIGTFKYMASLINIQLKYHELRRQEYQNFHFQVKIFQE